MKLLFLRHGLTQGNLEKRYIGTTDEPLCAAGIEALKQLTVPPCGQLFVSPLLRCRQSAELLFPGKAFAVADDLRECDFGRFEGKHYRELAADAAYQAWVDSGGTLPFPDGAVQPPLQPAWHPSLPTAPSPLSYTEERSWQFFPTMPAADTMTIRSPAVMAF